MTVSLYVHSEGKTQFTLEQTSPGMDGNRKLCLDVDIPDVADLHLFLTEEEAIALHIHLKNFIDDYYVGV